MSFHVLQSTRACSGTCTNCPRTAKRTTCDRSAPCPGYGASTACPPLIVLAVHEVLSAALQLAQPQLAPAFSA